MTSILSTGTFRAPLRGLRIRSFRAFDAFEAGPFRRFNFIVGPTPSGKTTVLHAVRFLESSGVGVPLLTGEYAGLERQRSGYLFRNFDPSVPARVFGDYEDGRCTEFGIDSVGPAEDDVEFTWRGGGFPLVRRTHGGGGGFRGARCRFRDFPSTLDFDPAVVFGPLGVGAVARRRGRPDAAEPWPADGRDVPIVVVHDLDVALYAYGCSAWPAVYRHVLESNAQLFTAAALPDFLSTLDPAPPASQTVVVTLARYPRP